MYISYVTCFLFFKVSKSSSDFWNGLKLTWKKCADLPMKCFVTSVAELDGKVYVAVIRTEDECFNPLVYDSYKDEWSMLPELPHSRFDLVVVPYKKQLLASGGLMIHNGKVSNKVFVWDEDKRKWTTPYPNMPTARYYTCSVSYESIVIVAGGVPCLDPRTLTGAVEVLLIKEHSGLLSKSHWIKVEQLPHVMYDAVPLIVNNDLYIAAGSGYDDENTCSIVTASLPELLWSTSKKARSSKVWNKLPDMLYSSLSINDYQDRLIVCTGDCKVEKPGKERQFGS